MHSKSLLSIAKTHLKSFNNYDWQHMPLFNEQIQELQDLVQSCFNTGMVLQQQDPPISFLQNLEKISLLLQNTSHKNIIFDILNLTNTKLALDGEVMAKACQEQGQAFVCYKGCAGCCHHLVMCEANEALLIAAYLEAHTIIKMKFIQNYALWDGKTANFRASYMAWAKELYSHGHDNKTHSLHDYVQACPFLDEQNACIIYAVRPYACRSTISVNPLCCSTSDGSAGQHTMQYSLYTGHHLVRKALMKLCNNNLFSTELISMPELVHSIICEKQ